jgi:hypothetical protein
MCQTKYLKTKDLVSRNKHYVKLRVDSKASQQHDSASLALCADAPAASLPSLPIMARIDPAVRSDVVRMLSRFVELRRDNSMRSIAGRIIDESRVKPRRKIDFIAELEALGFAEGLDFIRNEYIRHLLYAPPTLPRHLQQVTLSGACEDLLDPAPPVDRGDGIVLPAWPRAIASRPAPRTLPLRDAVQVVRGRPSRNRGTGTSARDFISDVNFQLEKLPAASAVAVVHVAEIKLDRIPVGNKLVRANRALRRVGGGGGKHVREFRAQRAAEVEDLAAAKAVLDAELRSQTHTEIYQRGLERLAELCTATAEIAESCFGFLREVA